MLINDINWKTTLASIASDKGQTELARYILGFVETKAPVYEILSQAVPVVINTDYSGLSPKSFNVAKPSYNLTVMPEATCDGCQ